MQEIIKYLNNVHKLNIRELLKPSCDNILETRLYNKEIYL